MKMKFWRVQGKGYTFEEMKNYSSINGGHSAENLGEHIEEGLCCCDTPECLRKYLEQIFVNEKDDMEIVVFKGYLADNWDCGDGVIAIPEEEVKRMEIAEFLSMFDKYGNWEGLI